MKQSLKILISAFAVIGFAATGAMLATPAYAQAHEREKQEKSGPIMDPAAKVTPVQAMKAAEAKVGGKAAMAMFEFDEGHWIYGVIVSKNHKLIEVDVDPITGKAGDTESVTPEDEGKEFQKALARLIK